MGARIVATYWTLGKYDFREHHRGAKRRGGDGRLVGGRGEGLSRSVTMRAFTMDEFEGIVAQAKPLAAEIRAAVPPAASSPRTRRRLRPRHALLRGCIVHILVPGEDHDG